MHPIYFNRNKIRPAQTDSIVSLNWRFLLLAKQVCSIPQRILNKRHDYTFQVIIELSERVPVNNLTSEDKSPNHVTSSKNADFDDNSF